MEQNQFQKIAQEQMNFAIRAGAQTQQAIEKMVFAVIDATVAAQEMQAKIAKDYFNTLSGVQKEIVKRSTEITEKAFEASASAFATATSAKK